MTLIDVLLTLQAAVGSVRSGWWDPLFVGFVLAAAVQLFLIVWVLVTDPDAGRSLDDG
jgi:hypothetical protein